MLGVRGKGGLFRAYRTAGGKTVVKGGSSSHPGLLHPRRPDAGSAGGSTAQEPSDEGCSVDAAGVHAPGSHLDALFGAEAHFLLERPCSNLILLKNLSSAFWHFF